MCESAFHWQDDSRNFIKRADIQNYFAFFGRRTNGMIQRR